MPVEHKSEATVSQTGGKLSDRSSVFMSTVLHTSIVFECSGEGIFIPNLSIESLLFLQTILLSKDHDVGSQANHASQPAGPW